MGRRHAVAVSFEPGRLALHQLTEGEALDLAGAAFAARGFSALLPGMYVGEESVDAVRAILAVQDVADGLPWFAPGLRAARLLRIEEDGDLTIALK